MPREKIKKREAAVLLNISDTLLANYIKLSEEINAFKSGNRWYLYLDEIQKWKELTERRKVILNINDYEQCLEFAAKINYSGHTRSDFSTSRQRGHLQAISNWTQGALAEIALKKFLDDKYRIKITLDFNVHTGLIVGQDITEVQKGRVINPPNKRVSIKSGKLNSCFIVVGEKEVELPERQSDYYVFVRVDFPTDLLLRVIKTHRALTNVQHLIPDFEDITAYICGFTQKSNLRRVDDDDKVLPFDITGFRYCKNIGGLSNTDEDWASFSESL